MPRINMLKIPNRLFIPILLFLIIPSAQAQSKIFKEIGEDIATQVKAIMQDNALVGYLAFTQLEKTDADSFNYRLTIMDENLNDIGTVNFRQRKLELQAVSFELDVLCLGYVESFSASMFTEKQRSRTSNQTNQTNQLLFQFINLSGKVINRYTTPVVLAAKSYPAGLFNNDKLVVVTGLRHAIQLRNLPGLGFAAFYGDENQREILLLDAGGKLIRRKKVKDDFPFYFLETSLSNIYLLTKMNIDPVEGGYKLLTYNTADSVKEFSVDLKDREGNWYKILTFDNDPVTGKAFIAGCIINQDRQKDFTTAHDYSKNPYLGVFSMTLGTTKTDVKTTLSYWSKGKVKGIDENGLWGSDTGFYAKYATAFRNFDGNTVFVATTLDQKRRFLVTAYQLKDALFITQDANGQLKVDGHFACDETQSFPPGGDVVKMDHKDFSRVVDQDTKTNFIIVDDLLNIYIYNFNIRKVMRTISHKDGSITTHVFPAKEGHILVTEYNKKQKQTRFSIEAL